MKFSKLYYRFDKVINRLRLRNLITILVFLLAVLALIIFLNKTKVAKAGWFNDAWQYRQKITLSSTNNSNRSYVQFRIFTNYDLTSLINAGKLQSNINDLRFTDTSGNLIKYWIEDATPNSADVWILVPTIPSSGTTIYMYYGNPAAATGSDISWMPSGGSISWVGSDRVHTFTNGGTFISNANFNVQTLVVAGGGGGGMDMGGGGGGGGVIYNSSYSITPREYPIAVGAGGAGAPAANTNGQPGGHQFTKSATSGGNSSFGTLTAIGGGYGGSSYWGYTPNNGYGGAGGSGGGSSGYKEGVGNADRAGTGTAGQGYRGGQSANNYYSGGGGGAGGAGADGPNPANGGIGYLSNINGTSLYWGGGGGGAGYSQCGGNGGNGGGGGGAVCTTTGGSGLNAGAGGGGGVINAQTNTPGGNGGANTGGGGGGGSHYNANNNGGNGGSGIVIIRYSSDPNVSIGSPTSEEKSTGPVAYWNFDEGYGSTIHNQTETNGENGLVAWYKFNESSPGVSYDQTNNINGTDTITTVTTGKVGSARNFDGANDYITLGNPAALQITGDQTIEMWLKPIDFNQRRQPYNKSYGGEGTITIEPDRSVSYYYGTNGNDGGSYQGFNTGSNALTAGVWNHIAIVRDLKAMKLKWYVNGSLVNQATASYAAAAVSTQNAYIATGYTYTGADYRYKGAIDNLKIYNRALTSGEISSEANTLHGDMMNYITTGSGTTMLFTSTANDGYIMGNNQVYATARSTAWSNNSGNISNPIGQAYAGGPSYYIYRSYFEFDTSAIPDNIIVTDVRLNLKKDATNWCQNQDFVTRIYKYDWTSPISAGNRQSNYSAAGVFDQNWTNSCQALTGNTWYQNSTSLDPSWINKTGLTRYQLRSSQDDNAVPPGALGYNGFIYIYTNESPGNQPYLSVTYNVPPIWSDGAQNSNQKPMGKSLIFNGTDQYVTMSKISVLEGANNYSLSAWVKTPSSGQQGIVGQYDALGNHIISMYLNNGTPTFVTYESGYSNLTANQTVNDDKWHHIVMTKSGTTGTIYIDGKSSGSGTVTNVTNTEGIKIGVRENNSYYFNGQIDEVKIFTHSLSNSQVQKEYNRGQGSALGVGTKTSDPGSNGLIAWYKMDEAGGITTYDSSGNNNNGTLGSGTSSPSWIQGKLGKALLFNGTTNYFQVSDSNSLKPTSALTISFWAYVTGNPITPALIVDHESASPWYGYGVSLDTSRRINFDLYTGASTTLTSNTSLSLNTWNLVTITYDGSKYYIYINGLLDNSAAKSGTINYTLTQDLVIGKRSQGPTSFFPGSLDNLKIFNRALSTSEISYEYSQSGPIFYYNLDEGNGSIIYNQTTNAAKQFQSSDPNLVSYWEFEEFNSTASYDLKGTNNGNFLIGNSAPSWTTNNKFGRSALSFNGDTTKINIPNNNSLNFGSNAFTISTWVNRLNDNGSTQDIVSKTGTDNSGGYKIGVGGAGEVYCQTSNGTDLQTSYTDYGMVNPGSGWHHLAITRSGSSCRIYVDNVDRTNTTEDHSAMVNNSLDLMIGGAAVGNPWGQVWDGYIDSVKIYNRYFSATDIATEYNRTNFTNLAYLYGLPSSWFDGAQANSNQKPMGRSLNFNGSTSYVESPAALVNSSSNANFSYSLWVKPSTNDGYLMSQSMGGINNNHCYSLFYDSSNNISLVTNGGTGNKLAYTYDLRNKWTHLVVSQNGSTNSLSLYVNGKQVITDTAASCNQAVAPQFFLGRRAYFSDSFYSGLMDEVKVFSYPLSAADVLTEYNRSSATVLGVGPMSNNPNLQVGTTSSLIAWYKLDDSSAGSAIDSSGNNQTGTFLSFPTWIQGKFGKALNFDNVDDGVSINNQNFTSLSDYSMCAWINPKGNHLHYTGTILSSGDWNTNHWAFGLNQTSTAIDLRKADGVNSVSFPYNFPLNKWSFACITRSDTNITAYANGTNIGTYTGTTGTLISNATNTTIGRETYAGGYFDFNGAIDNVKIYNKALSASEIAHEYTGSGGLGPIAHWRFDEKEGAIAHEDIKTASTLNLITNPSFENNTIGWTNPVGATITKSTDYAYFGNSSAKITTTGGIDAFGVNSWLNPLPNTIYTLSAWVYIPNKVGSPDFDRSLLIWDPSTGSNYTTISNIPQGVWTRVSTYVTTGASPTRIDSRIYSYNSNTPVYYDGVQLQQGLTVSPYCDGSLIGSGNSWTGAANTSSSICRNSLDGSLGVGSSAPTWTSGRFGNALSFNGTTNYVQVTNKLAFNFPGTTPFSVSAWINTSTPNTTMNIVSKWDENISIQWKLWLVFGHVRFSRRTAGGTSYQTDGNSYIQANTWYHVTAVYDGNNGYIYLNGKLDNTPTSMGSIDPEPYTNLLIGAQYLSRNPSTFFNGQIDEVKVYPYALTPNQVLIDYNNNAALRF